MSETITGTINSFAQNPGLAVAAIPERKPMSAALLGYLAGALGLAVWLGFGSPYGSLLGLVLLTGVLFVYNITAGFISSAMANLFLSLTGRDKQAGALFMLTGISDACKLLFIPLGMMAAAIPALRVLAFLLVWTVQYCFLIFAVDKLYGCGKTKAALATLLPFIFFCMVVTAFVLLAAIALVATLLSAFI